MMKLYGHCGACSQTIHILLHEAGAAFSFERVDLRTRLLADGSEFRAVSERGQVPALLLDDGTLLTELSAIAQFVVDGHPKSGLLPAVGSLARYQALSWLSYVGTELHKGVSPIMRPDTPDDYRGVARATLEAKLAWLDQQIADREFLAANQFTPADAYLFVVLGWLPMIGVDGAAFPNLMAFRARIAARPAVQAALAAEGF
jgi:glutathione S-transferase